MTIKTEVKKVTRKKKQVAPATEAVQETTVVTETKQTYSEFEEQINKLYEVRQELKELKKEEDKLSESLKESLPVETEYYTNYKGIDLVCKHTVESRRTLSAESVFNYLVNQKKLSIKAAIAAIISDATVSLKEAGKYLLPPEIEQLSSSTSYHKISVKERK